MDFKSSYQNQKNN